MQFTIIVYELKMVQICQLLVLEYQFKLHLG